MVDRVKLKAETQEGGLERSGPGRPGSGTGRCGPRIGLDVCVSTAPKEWSSLSGEGGRKRSGGDGGVDEEEKG